MYELIDGKWEGERGEKETRELGDILELQDEIDAIQNGTKREKGISETQRIDDEKGRVGKIVQASLDPEIYNRNQRNGEVNFNLTQRAREVIEHRMQPYYKLRRKIGVEDFNTYQEGKKVSFRYLGTPISVTWQGGNNFNWDGPAFMEIEERLLVQLGIGVLNEDEFGNKTYSVPSNVASNLGLGAEVYHMKIEEGSGILVRESDLEEYKSSSLGNDLTFGGLLSTMQNEKARKSRLETRIGDLFYNLYVTSRN